MSKKKQVSEVSVQDQGQMEWEKGYNEFMAKYPDCPKIEPVECLNLIMKREWAEEILRGKKKLEFRAFTNHYCTRLYDKNMMDYIDEHADDADFMCQVGNYVSALRPVEKIHFHNYNNSWFMDVSISVNEVVSVTEEDVAFLHSEFGCTELDDELELLKDSKRTPPMYFYFVIDDVLDTNLD